VAPETIHQSRCFEMFRRVGQDEWKSVEDPAKACKLEVVAYTRQELLNHDAGHDERRLIMNQLRISLDHFGFCNVSRRAPEDVRQNRGVEHDHRFARARL